MSDGQKPAAAAAAGVWARLFAPDLEQALDQATATATRSAALGDVAGLKEVDELLRAQRERMTETLPQLAATSAGLVDRLGKVLAVFIHVAERDDNHTAGRVCVHVAAFQHHMHRAVEQLGAVAEETTRRADT